MIPDITVTGSFSDAEEAFLFAKSNPPDAAILDIIMPVQDGITLADRLYETNPDMLIFFATASEQFALSAFRRRAVSYITKPYSFSDIYEAVERAKLLCTQKKIHIKVRTFGHFDIFVNNTLLKFPRQKCKELLAFFSGRLATLGLEELLLLVFVTWLQFNSTAIKLIAQVVVLVLNYVISKLLVFRKRSE